MKTIKGITIISLFFVTGCQKVADYRLMMHQNDSSSMMTEKEKSTSIDSTLRIEAK